MDIILLLLLACNGNLSYNNFIFILSFFIFNNQGNIYRNNLYNPYYNKSNFPSNNINKGDNINKSDNINIQNNRSTKNNMDTENDDTPSYGVAITDFENIDYESNNSEKTQLKDMGFTSSSQRNSSRNIPRNTSSTSRSKKTSFEKNNSVNNTKTTHTSKSSSSKNNSTYNKTTHTNKTNLNSQSKSWPSSMLGKNYKGTCTIVSHDGTYTGKIIGNIDNLITLKLEDDQVIYINKNSIISFY